MPDRAHESAGLLLLALLFGFLVWRGKKELEEDFAVAAMANLLDVPPDEASGWYAQAGLAREAGLYVDLDGGEWRTPRDITANDLAKAREAVLPLVRAVIRAVRSET